LEPVNDFLPGLRLIPARLAGLAQGWWQMAVNSRPIGAEIECATAAAKTILNALNAIHLRRELGGKDAFSPTLADDVRDLTRAQDNLKKALGLAAVEKAFMAAASSCGWTTITAADLRGGQCTPFGFLACGVLPGDNAGRGTPACVFGAG